MSLRSALEAPAGFVAERTVDGTLIVRGDLRRAVRDAGLDDMGRWDAAIASGRRASGRGATGCVDLPNGPRLVLKRMRRGGLAAPLWRDRFLDVDRLLGNLSAPAEVARRGIPTAPAAAMLLVPGPPGLYRAWLAVEEISDSQDLARRLASPRPPAREELAAVMERMRRMHDAGVEHRDLNLGNLLVRMRPGQGPEVFVVDLDRVVIHPGPLSFRARQAAIRRLERSYVKRFGDAGPVGAEPGKLLADLYAADDARTASRLRAGRLAGRVLLALHRAGWRS